MQPRREGFYLRMGFGSGYATMRGDGPNGSASISGIGTSMTISIGGSLAPGLVLAGTIQSAGVAGEFKGGLYPDATFSSGDRTVDVTNKASAGLSLIGGALDWYPSSSSGFHVGAGAGLGGSAVVVQADDTTYAGLGVAGSLTAGYDWSISRVWALGVGLLVCGATPATLKHAKSGNETGYKMAPLSIGVTTSILYF